jgi:hypothetical protein
LAQWNLELTLQQRVPGEPFDARTVSLPASSGHRVNEGVPFGIFENKISFEADKRATRLRIVGDEGCILLGFIRNCRVAVRPGHALFGIRVDSSLEI